MINKSEIQKIAKLAKIELSDSDVTEMCGHIQKMIDYFSEIEKVNTNRIEPLVTPVHYSGNLRGDLEIPVTATEGILESAPERVGNLYKVPPVL